MKLKPNKFHRNFQLNGKTFNKVEELLAYSQEFSDEIFLFLKDWFSDNENLIVKTSGSTGKPKSIFLAKENVTNSAKATGAFFNLKENTTALMCLPVNYIAGKLMLVRALTLGWQLDVVEPNSNPLENLNKEYDFSAMVPLQLENSLSKLNLIKKLIVGGGAVSYSLQNKLKDISTQVFATYGMTETITHIAVRKLNNNRLKPSFYKVLPNVNIYKDHRNCLVIQAPKVSKETIFTNDIVELISDTQFNWLGRFDNVINSGGVKLYPEEIEEKLSEIIVNRFFVTGIPDDKLGEKLILIIEGFVSGKMKKHLISQIENLASITKYEIPKQTFFVESFIETETKKIQRKKTLDKLKL